MPFDQFAAEIEAQPRPDNIGGPRVPCAPEAPEDARLLALRYPDAVVANGKQRDVWFPLFAQDDLDLSSLRAIFDGVREQVGEYLFNTHADFFSG